MRNYAYQLLINFHQSGLWNVVASDPQQSALLFPCIHKTLWGNALGYKLDVQNGVPSRHIARHITTANHYARATEPGGTCRHFFYMMRSVPSDVCTINSVSAN